MKTPKTPTRRSPRRNQASRTAPPAPPAADLVLARRIAKEIKVALSEATPNLVRVDLLISLINQTQNPSVNQEKIQNIIVNNHGRDLIRTIDKLILGDLKRDYELRHYAALLIHLIGATVSGNVACKRVMGQIDDGKLVKQLIMLLSGETPADYLQEQSMITLYRITANCQTNNRAAFNHRALEAVSDFFVRNFSMNKPLHPDMPRSGYAWGFAVGAMAQLLTVLNEVPGQHSAGILTQEQLIYVLNVFVPCQALLVSHDAKRVSLVATMDLIGFLNKAVVLECPNQQMQADWLLRTCMDVDGGRQISFLDVQNKLLDKALNDVQGDWTPADCTTVASCIRSTFNRLQCIVQKDGLLFASQEIDRKKGMSFIELLQKVSPEKPLITSFEKSCLAAYRNLLFPPAPAAPQIPMAPKPPRD